jgi:tetratricopeptide (TPR) repeat protein
MEMADRGIEVDPAEAHAYWMRGHIYRMHRRYHEAIADLTKAIELRPQVSRHFKHRAQAYIEIGEYEKALADARRSIEINPSYPPNWSVLFTVLLAMEDEEQLRIAEDELRKRVGSWYDHYGYNARSMGYNELSRIHRELGDYEQALADAERAIELAPSVYNGYLSRILVHKQLGDDEAAREGCDLLASIIIEDVIEDNARAGFLISACSRPEAAIDIYSRNIARAPDYWRTYNYRGNLHTQLKRFEESLADYKKALQLAPRSTAALNGYAWGFLIAEPPELRDPDKALALALRANVVTSFESANNLDTLALAYHMTGDHENAVETQRKAISLVDDRYREDFEKRLAEFEAALRGEQ